MHNNYSGRTGRFKRTEFRRRWARVRSKNSFKKRFSKKIDPKHYISDPDAQDKQTAQEIYKGIKFHELGLSKDILKRLESKKFLQTTKVQEKAIPHIQKGKDILGISATGSGKTGAFLIPLIDRLFKENNERILVVTPTRELALQIYKEAISLVKGSRVRVALVIGGESAYRQINSLRQKPRILVGTPGRLLDLENRGVIDFSVYNNVVIDEVDRMLDMGFIEDIKHIYSSLNENKQALFFSATINKKIQGIIDGMSSDYVLIKLSNNEPVNNIKQSVLYYKTNSEKLEQLLDLLKKTHLTKTLIFVNTKRYADTIAREIRDAGVTCGVIHGDKSQFKRRKVLDMYRSSKINVLIATNVAARGIDIDDISHVINLDEPDTFDEYVHRIGRTGRNGRSGEAITFVKK